MLWKAVRIPGGRVRKNLKKGDHVLCIDPDTAEAVPCIWGNPPIEWGTGRKLSSQPRYFIPFPESPSVPKHDVEVTQHAIDEYRDQTGSKRTDEWIARRITSMLPVSQEMTLEGGHAAIQIIRHGEPARYFKYSSFLMVMTEDLRTVITVHGGESGLWKAIKKK